MTDWILHLRKTEHPYYLTYEGSIAKAETGEVVDCHVLLGRDCLSLELSSTGLLSKDIADSWVSQLGPPDHDPIVYARGVASEEPSGEMILAATWRFPAEERERFQAYIETLMRR